MLQSDRPPFGSAHDRGGPADPPSPNDDHRPDGAQRTGSASSAGFGRVAAVDGSHATILVDTATTPAILEMLSVGKLIVIRSAQTRVVCLVYSNEGRFGADGRSTYVVEVEILGEIRAGPGAGPAQFDRGVSSYPHIGAEAEAIRRADLETIYSSHDANSITIGNLVQDPTIKATVRTNDLMQKHFAVLGTTGVGKSSAVSLILSEILAVNKTTRIMLVDPHNEYRRAFGDRANVVSPTNLRLPFWLFNFEEFADVIYRGRPGVDEELDALAEYIPMARAMYAGNKGNSAAGLARRDYDSGFTVDTPVPYRISDVVALIDQEIGRLDGKINKPKLKRLKARVESAARNAHYQFMFASLSVEDSMAEILMDLFRIPPDGRPITILELAGFAPEVVDAVVSVICRMAFDIGLWSNSQIPVLVVCEEAHRYVPADRTLGFGPTRKAISRIAKEGRKYGVYLGVVTQRPAELDATIVSQCSTIFAMRLSNEYDHAIIRSAVSDAAASILAFLPSIGNREAISFGEGVSMPMRMRFLDLAEQALPMRESKAGTSLREQDGAAVLEEIVQKWRAAEMRDARPTIRSGSASIAATGLRDRSEEEPYERPEALRLPDVMEDKPAPAATLRHNGSEPQSAAAGHTFEPEGTSAPARPEVAPGSRRLDAEPTLGRQDSEPRLRRPNVEHAGQQPEAQPPRRPEDEPSLRRPRPEPDHPVRRLEGSPTLRRSTFGTAGLRR